MEILKSETVKAAKEHRCNMCGGLINKGLVHNYQFNKCGGDVYSFRAHLKCAEMCKLLDLYRDADYGVDEEIYSESVNDVFAEHCRTILPDGEEFEEINELLSFVPTYEKAMYLYDKIMSGELK